jgi:hypothetical protein
MDTGTLAPRYILFRLAKTFESSAHLHSRSPQAPFLSLFIYKFPSSVIYFICQAPEGFCNHKNIMSFPSLRNISLSDPNLVITQGFTWSPSCWRNSLLSSSVLGCCQCSSLCEWSNTPSTWRLDSCEEEEKHSALQFCGLTSGCSYKGFVFLNALFPLLRRGS